MKQWLIVLAGFTCLCPPTYATTSSLTSTPATIPAATTKPEALTEVRRLLTEYRTTESDKEIDQALVFIHAENDPAKLNALSLEFTQALNAESHLKDLSIVAMGSWKQKLTTILMLMQAARHQIEEYETTSKNYADKDDYITAAKIYESIAKAYPDQAKRYYRPLTYYYTPDRRTNCKHGCTEAKMNEWGEKAIYYSKENVKAYPEQSESYHIVANVLGHARKYDEAIPYYEKAIAIDNNELSNYELAYLYEKKGDKAKQMDCLKRAVEKNPTSNRALETIAFLQKNGVTISADTSSNAVLLKTKQYDAVEKKLLALAEGNKKNENGRSLLALEITKINPADDARSEEWDNMAEALQQWMKASPNSYMAHLVATRFYKNYAWKARGSGFSHTITNDGGKKFYERLEDMGKYAQASIKLNPKNPLAYSSLITVAAQLANDDEERKSLMYKYLKLAAASDPAFYEPFYVVEDCLFPKWFGTWEEAYAFSKAAADHAPKGSLLPNLIGKYHWEMYHSLYNTRDEQEKYFKKSKNYKEVKAAYEKTLATLPHSTETQNWLARTAFNAEDWKTAQAMFDTIGDQWDKDCWQDKKWFLIAKRVVAEHLAKPTPAAQ